MILIHYFLHLFPIQTLINYSPLLTPLTHFTNTTHISTIDLTLHTFNPLSSSMDYKHASFIPLVPFRPNYLRAFISYFPQIQCFNDNLYLKI